MSDYITQDFKSLETEQEKTTNQRLLTDELESKIALLEELRLTLAIT